MQIRVDPISSVPVFLQIVQEVKSVVARGGYVPDEMIPSVRQMAAQVLVNPNTVARAYRELERDKVIYTRRGLGVFITTDAPRICNADRRRDIYGLLKQITTQAGRAGISESEVRDALERVMGDGVEDSPEPKTEEGRTET